jgi:hypothetical protein
MGLHHHATIAPNCHCQRTHTQASWMDIGSHIKIRELSSHFHFKIRWYSHVGTFFFWRGSCGNMESTFEHLLRNSLLDPPSSYALLSLWLQLLPWTPSPPDPWKHDDDSIRRFIHSIIDNRLIIQKIISVNSPNQINFTALCPK